MRRLALSGLALAAWLTLAPCAWAEVIAQAELPAIVQETVLNEAGSVALNHLERYALPDGRVVYQITWQLSGIEIGILVDSEGRVLDRLRRPAVD